MLVGAFAAVAVVAHDGVGPRGARDRHRRPPAAERGRRVATVAHGADDAGRGRRHSSEAALDELARLAGWGGCPVWRSFDVAATVGPRSEVEAAIRGQAEATRASSTCPTRPATVAAGLGRRRHPARPARGFRRLVRRARARRGLDGRAVGQRGDVAVRLLARPPGGTAGAFWQISGRAAPAPYCLDRTTSVRGPDPRR